MTLTVSPPWSNVPPGANSPPGFNLPWCCTAAATAAVSNEWRMRMSRRSVVMCRPIVVRPTNPSANLQRLCCSSETWQQMSKNFIHLGLKTPILRNSGARLKFRAHIILRVGNLPRLLENHNFWPRLLFCSVTPLTLMLQKVNQILRTTVKTRNLR